MIFINKHYIMAYRWGIKNCCDPYEAFPVSTSFAFGMGILNSGVVSPGQAYYFATVTFDTSQTFYKPDGTTYSPHCWEIIYDSAASMSTVEVTDWTYFAWGSPFHPEDDCAALIADRLWKITNHPTVYGTQPCCPTGSSVSIPNGVRSCCDHSIQYYADPFGAFATAISTRSVGEAFYGALTIVISNNNGTTSITDVTNCWELIDDATGPSVFPWPGSTIWTDCQELANNNMLAGLGPCCPPIDECDSALLFTLQTRLDSFKVNRDIILSPPDLTTVINSNWKPKGNVTPGKFGVEDHKGTPRGNGGKEDVVSDGGRGESDSACCKWCLSGRDSIAPDGCLDWMCDGCVG